MSVQFYKSGVVEIGCDVINENLCIDTMKDFGKSHTSYNIADYNLSESLVEGEKYTISAKINLSVERKSVGFFLSGGSYGLVYWLQKTDSGIYTGTFTANANHAASTSGGGHGYVRAYSSSKTTGGGGSLAGTANVDWIKVEKGELVTPWCQNASDAGYVGLTHGVIENEDVMTIYNGRIETTSFIEY